MANIDDFETDMRKLRRKKKTKRFIKNLAFILAVLIVAFLIYITKDSWISYFDGIVDRARQDTAVVNDGELAGGNYPIDISKKTNTSIGKIQKNWTLFADTTFYVYDTSGDIVYSSQASYSNPIVAESVKRTLVYDQGGYSFMVAGPKKEIYSKRLDSQILLGAVGADGSVAIVTQNEKYASYLTIYDKNGSEIYHWADGTMITACAINDAGSGCLIASTYARGGAYRTQVTKLDFESDKEVMQTPSFETLGLAIGYCDGGIWLIGHDKMYRLNDDGGIVMSFDYDYDLLMFSMCSKNAVLAFEGAGGDGGGLAIIKSDSESVFTERQTGNPNDLYATDSAVYICYGDRIDAIDRDGNLLATAPTDTVYRQFTVLSGEIYLLGYRTVEKIDFTF